MAHNYCSTNMFSFSPFLMLNIAHTWTGFSCETVPPQGCKSKLRKHLWESYIRNTSNNVMLAHASLYILMFYNRRIVKQNFPK